MTTDATVVRFCNVLGVREAEIPPWMSEPLIATMAARHKLRVWARTTPRETWTAPIDPEAIWVGLHAFGDEVLPHRMARLLARLPPPVTDYILTRTTILALGCHTVGFAGPRIPFTPDRPHFVALSARKDADSFDDTAGHEFAHVWLLDPPENDSVLDTAFFCQTVEELPMEQVPAGAQPIVKRYRALAHEYELECLRLTRTWGLRDVGAAA